MVAVTPSASVPVAVTAPVRSPVTSPVTLPVTFPVTAPVWVPALSPVKSPVTSPVTFPVTLPVTFPVTFPVTSPVSPPAKAVEVTLVNPVMVVSRLRVTVPLVPPPFKFVPAVTPVISPVSGVNHSSVPELSEVLKA